MENFVFGVFASRLTVLVAYTIWSRIDCKLRDPVPEQQCRRKNHDQWTNNCDQVVFEHHRGTMHYPTHSVAENNGWQLATLRNTRVKGEHRRFFVQGAGGSMLTSPAPRRFEVCSRVTVCQRSRMVKGSWWNMLQWVAGTYTTALELDVVWRSCQHNLLFDESHTG